ncbi:phage tail protein [Campylobacter concisus]
MKQYTLLTASGINKLLKTASDGSKIALKEVVVSDYEGELSEQTTSIPNEKYRGAINAVTIDESDSNILDVDVVIPPEVGGFYIKTAGIYCDDGSLFAVARLADTYKPLLNEGSSKDITLNFKLQIANASESIILKVDNNIVLATRKWCEKMFLKLKDKIDAYTKKESDDKFLKKTDKIDAYTKTESDEKFALKDDLPELATETKTGITKLKNIVNAKQTDVAVTEKAVSDAIEAMKNSVAGTAKLSTNGYIKLPSGLILQWMRATSGGTQLFPITFPNECFFVSATHTALQGSTEAVGIVSTRSFSNSRATFWSSQSGSGAMISGQCLLIFAIGW